MTRPLGAELTTHPPRSRTRTPAVLGAITLLVAAVAATAAAAATPRTSLPAVESQVMCVTCKIPLTVAQSPQADRERAYIQELIDQGKSEAQVKQALVGQYGPQVLALPATHGFGLAAYLVPIVGVAFVLGLLLLLLPRWRRRGRTQAALAAGVAGESAGEVGESEADVGARAGQTLSPADAARLEADLARFD